MHEHLKKKNNKIKNIMMIYLECIVKVYDEKFSLKINNTKKRHFI